MNLSLFLELESYSVFAGKLLNQLNTINSAVLTHLIESKEAIHLNHSRVINGVQKTGSSSMFFGVEFVFYSEEVDELQANCVNVNFSLRNANEGLLLQYSIDSIYDEVELPRIIFSEDESDFSKLFDDNISLETVKVVSNFLEKSRN